jgi:hypothetical protein
MDEDLMKALRKKAKGYKAKEVADEFVVGKSGTPVLSRRKITYKDVPPDIGAVKTIAEILNGGEYRELTPEELKKEKQRLLEELKNESETKEEL